MSKSLSAEISYGVTLFSEENLESLFGVEDVDFDDWIADCFGAPPSLPFVGRAHEGDEAFSQRLAERRQIRLASQLEVIRTSWGEGTQVFFLRLGEPAARAVDGTPSPVNTAVYKIQAVPEGADEPDAALAKFCTYLEAKAAEAGNELRLSRYFVWHLMASYW